MKLLTPINKFLRKTRERLSNYPIIYAMFGGVGIILFWRGVWHTADFLPMFINNRGESSLDYTILWDSLISTFVGFVLLFVTGLFVTDFIGSQIISTTAKTEKKIEKIAKETESEEKTEEERLDEIEKKFEEVTSHLDEHLENIEEKLKNKK